MILWKYQSFIRVLIQASGDPFRLIAGFLSLRFELINMTGYGCLVRLKYACDLKNRSAMVSQFAQRLVLC